MSTLPNGSLFKQPLVCYGTHNLGLRLALHQGQQHRPWVPGNSITSTVLHTQLSMFEDGLKLD